MKLASRLILDLDFLAWMRDHHIGDGPVLPAVASLSLLAQALRMQLPQAKVDGIRSALFPRFLEMSAEATPLTLHMELLLQQDGNYMARLFSRRQYKALARSVLHAEAIFAQNIPHEQKNNRSAASMQPDFDAVCYQAAQAYQRFIPFGPGFQSLEGKLWVGQNAAWGQVRALPHPMPSSAPQELLGSPFPFDGAMHLACVQAQHVVAFIPFPVGFTQRRIHRPTEAGKRYLVNVALEERAEEELIYSLCIQCPQGMVYEEASGLRMRRINSGAHLVSPVYSK